MKNRNLDHKDTWATPKWFYDKLDAEFHFDFDPCPLNPTFDGLASNLGWGLRNFINPPYSQKLKEAFIHKALEESRKGKMCVMLLPVSTSTKIFHEVIKPNAMEWSKEQLQDALDNSKRSNELLRKEYLGHNI